MTSHEISPHRLFIETVWDRSLQQGWLVLISILLLSCIITRITTSLQSRRSEIKDSAEPRPVRIVPYWVPWLGHTLSFSGNHVKFLENSRGEPDEPVFGIKLGGIKHIAILSPSMAKSFFSFPGSTSASLINYALKQVFGDRGPILSLNDHDHHVFHHNVPKLFMNEPFVTAASARLSQLLQRETTNFVTFSRSIVDQTPWERVSDATVVEGGTGNPTCEVDFFALIRSFVGHLTTSTIMGQALLEAFPNLLNDVWSVNDQFSALCLGVPRILSPGVSAAYGARHRLLDTVAKFHQAFITWDEGEDPGMEFRDLEDVSEPIKERIRLSKRLGLSPVESAPGHLSLLWAMNGNSPNIVFWLLLRLYTNPTLLADIRKEIAPYVIVTRPSMEETGFPIQVAPSISIDIKALHNSCQLLKASLYETLRLDSAGLSFRELTSDLTLTESEEEAKLAGLSPPRTYKLGKGERVVISLGVLQKNPQVFSNPSQFDPLRFLETAPKSGNQQAKMESIWPFGGGMSSCKGRAFAERQILAFSAAIVSMWDVAPAASKEWNVPQHKFSSAAFLPKKEIRVRISERIAP